MALRGIPLLRDDQLVLPVRDAEFSPLVADSLGNELVDGDGWDDTVNTIAAAIAEDADLAGSLVSDLLDADFVEGVLTQETLVPLAASTGEFVTSGDALFSDMADAIANDPTRNPPGGGGGGEGGGGNGGGGGGGGQGGGDQGGGGLGGGDEVRCHLVIARDGGSQYVCEVIPGSGGEFHPPLKE
jgi:hypothetical protein